MGDRGQAADEVRQTRHEITGIDKGMGRGHVLRPSWVVGGVHTAHTAPTRDIAALNARWAATAPDGPVLRQARGRRAIPRSARVCPLATFAAITGAN